MCVIVFFFSVGHATSTWKKRRSEFFFVVVVVTVVVVLTLKFPIFLRTATLSIDTLFVFHLPPLVTKKKTKRKAISRNQVEPSLNSLLRVIGTRSLTSFVTRKQKNK